MRRAQRGATMLIVLILMAVIGLAAMALARTTETSTAIAGNLAFKAAAMQASEAGLSEAFARLQALSDAATAAHNGTWYFATRQASDTAGMPSGVTWTSMPAVTVPGGYTARFVVERMCTGTLPIADITQQCVVKRLAAQGSAKAGSEEMQGPSAVQYRMTVFVQGPKGTNTFVQAMATKAS